MKNESDNIENICAELLAGGWHESPNQFKAHSRCFYKRFDTPTRCSGNNDKLGMQIGISVSYLGQTPVMELELCAGLADGTWVKILNYSLPETLSEVTDLIPRLLRVWECANANDSLQKENTFLTEENRRLREALVKIRDGREVGPGSVMEAEFRRIAKLALNPNADVKQVSPNGRW